MPGPVDGLRRREGPAAVAVYDFLRTQPWFVLRCGRTRKDFSTEIGTRVRSPGRGKCPPHGAVPQHVGGELDVASPLRSFWCADLLRTA